MGKKVLNRMRTRTRTNNNYDPTYRSGVDKGSGTVDTGRRKKKDARKADLLQRRLTRSMMHSQLTDNDVRPRRKDGNKLGLRKRVVTPGAAEQLRKRGVV